MPIILLYYLANMPIFNVNILRLPIINYEIEIKRSIIKQHIAQANIIKQKGKTLIKTQNLNAYYLQHFLFTNYLLIEFNIYELTKK